MRQLSRASVLALLLAAFAAFLLPPASHSAEPDGGAMRVERAINYASPGGEKLYLDLAVPPGPGPFPCVVMLHGGAWQWGNRKELSAGSKSKPSWIETVAAKGYVTASVGYRLAPKYKFPAQIEDARAAVRYLRANAAKYRIDSERVGAVGFSAGAHLALLLGLCDKSAGFDVGDNLTQSGRVQCVIDFFGPTDLKLYAGSEGIVDGYMVPFLGKACKTDPELYKRASPLSYVEKNEPPILILQGTFDFIVPARHAEELYHALKDAGDTVEMITFPGAGHGNWNNEDMQKAEAASYKFMDKYLKGKP